MPIDFKRQAQIKNWSKAQIEVLLFNKASIKILMKYSDYNNVFSMKNAIKLSKNTEINKHTIQLEKNKQPPFGLIYNLGPVKLKILKTYIKTNLANNFI